MTMNSKTSASMKEVKECLCRNGIVGRGHEVNAKRPHGYLFFLFCMMCGRRSEGNSPREVVDAWNKDNADVSRNPISTHYQREKVFCPHCGKDVRGEESTTADTRAPGEGDIGVGTCCGKWWRLEKGLRVKYDPTPADLKALRDYLTARS